MRPLVVLVGLGLLAAAVLPAPAEEGHAPRLRVPEGFQITQVAGEPQVRFPMFVVFDDRGRLFVAESSDLDLYAALKAGSWPVGCWAETAPGRGRGGTRI